MPFASSPLAGVLDRNVHFYSRLQPADQSELRGHIQVFLAEKCFEGCAGLVITDEIRVTIAAHACMLLMHRQADYYPLLVTILVYPHAFVVTRTEPGPAGLVVESQQALAGESWRHGVVVLAWDHVNHQASDIHDGHNVVLHEFAHQLDEENGVADGTPPLPLRSMYVPWARVVGQEYTRLVQETEQGHGTFLDPYGGTNPAEFFAVATEFFFESPMRMRDQHPDLYAELKLYYQQDPAEAVAEGSRMEQH
ncbi:MAG: M90 family metallopeptidase, partial [bacterium]